MIYKNLFSSNTITVDVLRYFNGKDFIKYPKIRKYFILVSSYRRSLYVRGLNIYHGLVSYLLELFLSIIFGSISTMGGIIFRACTCDIRKT